MISPQVSSPSPAPPPSGGLPSPRFEDSRGEGRDRTRRSQLTSPPVPPLPPLPLVPRRWGFYALALTLFLLAMFAKTASSLLVVALLLVLWWRGTRGNRGRYGLSWRALLPLVPFVALIVLFSQATFSIEKLHGAEGEFFRLPFGQRLLVSATSFWFYAGKLLVPYPLVFIYSKWRADDPRQWLAVAALVGLLAGLWLARKRLGRGVLVAVLYFYVGSASLILAQVLFMMQFTWVADHWQYLASMSLIALAAAGATLWWRRAGPTGRAVGSVACGIVLMVLGLRTAAQASNYTSSGRLWESVLAWNNTSSMVHNNYGGWLQGQNRLQEALVQFQRAVELDPRNDGALRNLGGYYLDHGEYDQALAYFRAAAKINANLKELQYNLGVTCHHKGLLPQAIIFYRNALRLDAGDVYKKTHRPVPVYDPDPDPQTDARVLRDSTYAAAHAQYGAALLETGDAANAEIALTHLEIAVKLDPRQPQTQFLLGKVYAGRGQWEAAAASLQNAVDLQSDFIDARMYRGAVLYSFHRTDQAVAQYEEILRVHPDHAGAHCNLGSLLFATGRDTEALQHFQKALDRQPDFADALTGLARVLVVTSDPALRDPQKAVGLAEKACELTKRQRAPALDALASAYAAVGRFPDAVATIQLGIQRAQATGNSQLIPDMNRRLQLYQSGRAGP